MFNENISGGVTPMNEELLAIKKFITRPVEVLLIEDDPVDARIVKEFLKESEDTRFNVTCRSRLSEGVTAISQMEFDVVILDLALPDSLGFNTFRELRAKVPTIPIIVLTGSSFQRDELRKLLDNTQNYLVKGYIDSISLVSTIFEAIELLITDSKPSYHTAFA